MLGKIPVEVSFVLGLVTDSVTSRPGDVFIRTGCEYLAPCSMAIGHGCGSCECRCFHLLKIMCYFPCLFSRESMTTRIWVFHFSRGLRQMED